LQWKAASSSQWNNVTGITAPPFTLNGLNSCTRYEFRVETDCPTGSSVYSNAINFTTVCPTSNTHLSPRMTKAENENAVLIKIYPNPVRDNLAIEYNSVTSGTITTNVYNMIGKNVMNTIVSIKEGKNIFNLNTSQLSEGIYFFEIENNGELIRNKFMVSK